MQTIQSDKFTADRGTSHMWLSAAVICGLMLISAAAAAADRHLTMPNESWITMSGTVDGVQPNSFRLDYGDGTVTIEMDDGDRDADAYKLLSGDEVTVTGRIDRDLFERTTIEASTVYVRNIGTTFRASSVDEEGLAEIAESVTSPMPQSSISIIGEVTEVDRHRFFTLDTGLRAMRVDVSQLSYDPLDDEGYQKIEVGDIVKVVGKIDDDLFAARKLTADVIIEFHDS